MIPTHDAARRGAGLRRAVLAAGLLSLPAMPALAGGEIKGEGIASFYGREHHGGPTASGERFDMRAMTAAHRTAPLGSRLKVTNLKNGKSVVVRINDRGPYIRGRVIDLSRGAADVLDFTGAGLTRVAIETIEIGQGRKAPMRVASLETPSPTVEKAAEPASGDKPALSDLERLMIDRTGASAR